MGEKPALKRKSGSKLPHSMRSYLRDEVYHRLEICQEQFCPKAAAPGYLRKVAEDLELPVDVGVDRCNTA